MDHWLSLGLSGFRVDMAASLVKDDPGHVETAKLWRELRGWLDDSHPHAALLSEWGDPAISVPAGFHADFFLQFGSANDGLYLRSLWNNFMRHGQRPLDAADPVLRRVGRRLRADLHRRLARGPRRRRRRRLHRPAHRQPRLLPPGLRAARRRAAARRLRVPAHLAHAARDLLRRRDRHALRPRPARPRGQPPRPPLQPGLPRTPMQWDDTPNAGFSTAPADRLYLPVDPDANRPTVAAQQADPDSLLNLVRRLIALRRATPDLGPAGSTEVLHDGYPLAYVRGGRYLVVVNPSGQHADTAAPKDTATPVVASGVTVSGGRISADGFGYGIFEL